MISRESCVFGDAPPAPDALPGAGGAALLLRPLLETTRHLPATEQFDFWRSCNGNMLEHMAQAAPPKAGFLADAATWRFGNFAMMTADISAGRYRRTPAHIRRDGIDHWVLTIATHGERVFRSGDTVQVMRPGRIFVGSLDQAFETARTGSGWIHLYVPRDVFPEIGSAIDAMRLNPLDTPMGHVLHDYLTLLAARMPEMREADAAQLAAATRAMVAAALVPSADRRAGAAAPVHEVQIARGRRIIRENLRFATLGPDRLCRLVGMSRSQLYRLLEPHGGVAAAIQAERLRAAQRALCDPTDTRTIARIAEDVGLFDGSTFSRMFRRAFDVSPREMRLAALSGQAVPNLPASSRGGAPRTIRDLLYGLSG